MTGQSNDAAERSAHVLRGGTEAADSGAIVEVAPGVARLRVAIERDALGAEVERLRAVLAECAAQFDFYAEYHRAKRTMEADSKAVVNEVMARKCRAALIEEADDA